MRAGLRPRISTVVGAMVALVGVIAAPLLAQADQVSCEGNIANGQAEIRCTSPDPSPRTCQFTWGLATDDGAQQAWQGQFTTTSGDDHALKALLDQINQKPVTTQTDGMRVICK